MSNIVLLRPRKSAVDKRQRFVIDQALAQLNNWRHALNELREYEQQILTLETELYAKVPCQERAWMMVDFVAARKRIQERISECEATVGALARLVSPNMWDQNRIHELTRRSTVRLVIKK
jgi:hypothetical protein